MNLSEPVLNVQIGEDVIKKLQMSRKIQDCDVNVLEIYPTNLSIKNGIHKRC